MGGVQLPEIMWLRLIDEVGKNPRSVKTLRTMYMSSKYVKYIIDSMGISEKSVNISKYQTIPVHRCIKHAYETERKYWDKNESYVYQLSVWGQLICMLIGWVIITPVVIYLRRFPNYMIFRPTYAIFTKFPILTKILNFIFQYAIGITSGIATLAGLRAYCRKNRYQYLHNYPKQIFFRTARNLILRDDKKEIIINTEK